jgi:20S proteasome alpha/beta subunit
MKFFYGLVALLTLCTAALASEKEENPVVHGTINVVLANKNGMVVLTDSMLTAGDEQLSTPGKKLFRLDDHSVCAIAGIIASPSGSYKELDLSTVAAVDDYASQIGVGPPISIGQKLRELAFLLNINISAVENVRNANGKSLNPDSYVLQLIVAGYDTDGVLKIGKVNLRSRNRQGNFDSEIESGQIRSVTDNLEREFSGIPDKAELIMAHPETVTQDDAISAYYTSLKSDLGRSLTLGQMTELAKRLKYYSTLAHREVGGPDQIALLQNGKITSFWQPPFPNSAQARRFSLIVASSFSGSSVLFRGNAAAVFVRCSWNFFSATSCLRGSVTVCVKSLSWSLPPNTQLSFRPKQAEPFPPRSLPANVPACAVEKSLLGFFLSCDFSFPKSHRFPRHLSTGAFNLFRAALKSRRQALVSSPDNLTLANVFAKSRPVHIFRTSFAENVRPALASAIPSSIAANVSASSSSMRLCGSPSFRSAINPANAPGSDLIASSRT